MDAKNSWKTFVGFALRVMVAHTLTYFLFGLLMSNVFHYGAVFTLPIIRDYMLPIAQHDVAFGPFLQPVRGLIFAIGLWPIRGLLVQSKRGWLILWGLLVTVGILSTPAASPSSVEGVLYTRLPMWYHLMGLPEILLQTLVFSIWLVWWERQADRAHQPAAAREANPMVAEAVQAIMAACFAYIGYAAGGLLLAAMANARAAAGGAEGIDVQAAGMNFRMQFMFVIAFFANAAGAFWLARRWRLGRISLWAMFLFFWFIDAFVPWLYQTLVFGGSFIPTALLLGVFPALILAAVIWLNNRHPVVQAGRP